MYYSDNYFGQAFNPTPDFVPQQSTAQQQTQSPMGGGIDPMQALQMYQQFSGGGGLMGGGSGGGLSGLLGGGGGAVGGGGASAATGLPASMGGVGAATGTTGGGAAAGGAAAGGGASGAMGALASSPVGWIAAAALGQQVMHNKDISSWQAGLKGQGGRNIGDHFINQWGLDGTFAEDVLGVLGWGKEGGILNPSYLSTKIFGEVD